MIKNVKISIILISFTLIFSASCNVKEPCEIYDEGKLCVMNNTESVLTVYIDGSKVMEVPKGERKCVEKSVGTYTLKCFSELDEWTKSNITVFQCKPTSVSVP